ncbi:MAG: hypothetical protein M0R21_12595 [Lentimicrobiaceae bacterium]|nr:hypothetical protein [Lentimicrobiaceae bacterium]
MKAYYKFTGVPDATTRPKGMGKKTMSEHVHKFYPEITCTVVSETNKGFKVLQNDPRHKKKPKVAFYSFLDFSNDKGVWIRK